jgi:hypothetical protein
VDDVCSSWSWLSPRLRLHERLPRHGERRRDLGRRPRALSPRLAVLVAAIANLAGAFVTTAVAKTVGKGIIDTASRPRRRCSRR